MDLGALEHHRSGYKLGLGLLQLGATTPAANMRDLSIPFLVAAALTHGTEQMDSMAGDPVVQRLMARVRLVPDAGFDAHFTKPVYPEHLRQLLFDRLEGAGAGIAG